MSNQSFNKKQLQEEADAKARASVQGDAGLDELMRFTLDNFAFRYLETKNASELKSYAIASHAWRVEGCESELMEALKAQNPETKKALITRAKEHGRKDGANVYAWLEVSIKDQTAICRAGVDWESDGQRANVSKQESKLKFDDELMLRNSLARALEEVCVVF